GPFRCLRADLRRVLAGLRGIIFQHRCDRDRGAAGARDRRIATTARRLRRRGCARDAAGGGPAPRGFARRRRAPPSPAPLRGAPLDLLLDGGADIIDSEAFADARTVPSLCRTCSYVGTCSGGCAGRRRLINALDAPDPYCPVVRGGSRKLKVQMARSRELSKLESACTTIVV